MQVCGWVHRPYLEADLAVVQIQTVSLGAAGQVERQSQNLFSMEVFRPGNHFLSLQLFAQLG